MTGRESQSPAEQLRQGHKARKMAIHNRRVISIASWNVRTLVESAGGDRRVCRSRPQPSARVSDNTTNDPHLVDRKLDLLVKELKRYNISITAVQETKWFGSDIWKAEGHVLLHSGQPLPSISEAAVRREGVGILLDEKAAEAWRLAGETWQAVSPRIVSARLKLVRAGLRRPGGLREAGDIYMSVISAYAPTARAPPRVKQQFIEDLQHTIDNIPPSDVLLVLGDFNARVGRGIQGDVWRGVRGRHGLGNCNEAGEDLLEFCAVNRLTIMNTWFTKKAAHLATWKHPATKQLHMIDYIILRAEQRTLCQNVQVMRGATCWTDHFLVRGRINLSLPKPSKRGQSTRPISAYNLQYKETREFYQEELDKCLGDHPHVLECPAQQNWNTLKCCIVSAAEAVLGRGKKRQPDWFIQAADMLQPLLQAKQRAHNKMLHTNSTTNKREFRRHQRAVKHAVDSAKEKWICKVAEEAERAKTDGRTRWASIRHLQMTYAGRRPTRHTAIQKENGEITRSPEEVRTRWWEHFNRVLNVPSEVDQDVVGQMPSWPTEWELDRPPSEEEMLQALGKLRKGKAGGKSGILPELLVYGGAEMCDRLLMVMKDMWEEGRVVDDWRNAEIVPIPKKGSCHLKCDNWRGISLLDVAGKVFARILKDRLEVIAERVLPESQCGFRRGRGCIDMIFATRQLVEKTIEHDDSLFILFIDLKKAYDSVPRDAMWTVLTKFGVPPTMLGIIRSFHEDMRAEIRIGDLTTDCITVRNGLRQGCTLAPTLFNLYFSAVVACWRARCPQAGVSVRYKHGRKLVGDRTTKSRLLGTTITETQFADDAAVFATSRAVLESATSTFINTASEWGLTVSIQKTKAMAVGSHLTSSDTLPLQLREGEVEMVHDFTYLGSTITNDGEVKSEIGTRIAKAARAFGCLQKPIFQNKRLSVETKRKVYKATVLSVLLYGMETWNIKAHSVRRLNGFHNRCVRTILGVSRHQQWKDRISSQRLAESFGMEESMKDILLKHRLRWLGHLGRMDTERIPKQLLFGELWKKRPCHGPRKRWRDLAAADVKSIGIGDDWYDVAQDRREWRAVCRDRLAQLNNNKESAPCAANRVDSEARAYTCQCGRSFRRQGDLTRHRRFCNGQATNQLAADEPVTHHCACGRKFRRAGDIARHRRFCSVSVRLQ